MSIEKKLQSVTEAVIAGCVPQFFAEKYTQSLQLPLGLKRWS
jgi:hypothetical protein